MEKKYSKTSLFWPVCFLSIIGLIMVYSASKIIALDRYNDACFFVKRQAIYLSLGFVGMFIVENIPYSWYKRWARLLFFCSLFLLVIVLVPGVGLVSGGARSWIGLSSINIQPAEIVKVSLIIYLCEINERLKYPVSHFSRGMAPRLVIILSCFFLVMLQPDLGSGLIIVLGGLAVVYFQGAQIKHFYDLFLIGVVGLTGLILAAPYRMRRLTAFLDPWQDPLGSGFQSIQSLLAIGPGGLLGSGLFNGKQKHFYLPEPHNDFIFAIVAEELGFVGAIMVILCFMIFFYRGLRISLLLTDTFARTLCLALIVMMISQAWINLAVVTGLLPVTGLTLPFLSYGGSSLVINYMAVGILLNIEKHTV